MWSGGNYYPETDTDEGVQGYDSQHAASALLDSVLPEESPYLTSDPTGATDSLHLNVAAHSNSLFAYQDPQQYPHEDFLRAHSAGPDDTFSPEDALKRMSLDDIDEPLQVQEPLNLDAYLQDPSDEGAVGYSTQDAYSYTTTAPPAGGSLFMQSTPHQSYPPIGYGNQVYVSSSGTGIGHPDSLSGEQNYSPIMYQSNLGYTSLSSTTGASSSTYALDSTNLNQQANSLDYADPFGSQLSNTPYQLPTESEYLEISSDQMLAGSSIPPSSGRKGYKHRHERVYGLSEEEQKKRNQELNNEASQIYRQKKSKKTKDLEQQLENEEDRNKKLKKIYEGLLLQRENILRQGKPPNYNSTQ